MNWVADLIPGLRDIAIVVFLGYGLNLMKQQNELLEGEKALKQSEIDVHKAEIDVHKANIERLKATQAPAIAQDLEQMTRTANNYAEQGRGLAEQVKILAKENQATAAMIEKANILGIAAGCLEALALLAATQRVLLEQPDPAAPVPLRTLGFARIGMSNRVEDVLVKSLNTNFQQISDIADQALKGQRPELKYWKAEVEMMEKKGLTKLPWLATE